MAKSVRTENACISEGRRENVVRWSRTAFICSLLILVLFFLPTLEKGFYLNSVHAWAARGHSGSNSWPRHSAGQPG